MTWYCPAAAGGAGVVEGEVAEAGVVVAAAGGEDAWDAHERTRMARKRSGSMMRLGFVMPGILSARDHRAT
jgi:hypothetical protein